MLSNQIATSNIKMKTYQQLWQSLTPLYDAGEAQACSPLAMSAQKFSLGSCITRDGGQYKGEMVSGKPQGKGSTVY